MFVASVTPLRDDFQCDVEAIAAHTQNLLSRGCQGVVLFGTTGEGPSFGLQERIDILKELVHRGLDPQKIIIGASCACYKEVIALVQAAADLGCLAALIAPPFFFKGVSDEGVVAFYRQIVAASRLPILLYHIPQHSGVPLSFRAVENLYSEFPTQIVGLKESEGNFSFTQHLLQKLKGFKLFVGNESHITEAMKLGAAGTICGLANIYPEFIASLFNRYDERIVDLQNILKGYSLFPAIKALVAQEKGAPFKLLRPPLMPLSKEAGFELHATVAKLKLDPFL